MLFFSGTPSRIQWYNLPQRVVKRTAELVQKLRNTHISYYVSLLRVIRRKQPDIIHTQSQVSFVMVTILRKLRLISRKIKLVHTDRGLYINYNHAIKTLFSFLMKELDTLITTTKFNLHYWQQANSRIRENELDYKVIGNTAGTIFEDYNTDFENTTEGTFTVGFSGRYSEQKDWPLAAKLIRELDQCMGENLRVKIAMGVLDKQADLKTAKMFTELKELLGDRFEGNVNITLEEMDRFYYDLDVFIMTSKPNSESFGRTLVEAMSRKTAVLTTNAGGPEEVVRDKTNVCYTVSEFVDNIMNLYLHPEVLTQEKMSNLNHVKKNYSLEKNIHSHVELYDRLLKKKFREGVAYDITYNSRV